MVKESSGNGRQQVVFEITGTPQWGRHNVLEYVWSHGSESCGIVEQRLLKSRDMISKGSTRRFMIGAEKVNQSQKRTCIQCEQWLKTRLMGLPWENCRLPRYGPIRIWWPLSITSLQSHKWWRGWGEVKRQWSQRVEWQPTEGGARHIRMNQQLIQQARLTLNAAPYYMQRGLPAGLWCCCSWDDCDERS